MGRIACFAMFLYASYRLLQGLLTGEVLSFGGGSSVMHRMISVGDSTGPYYLFLLSYFLVAGLTLAALLIKEKRKP